VSFLAERSVYPAFGIQGGQAGTTGALAINGKPTDPKRQYVLAHGDTVHLTTLGGGGHGDPKERDRAALHSDIDEGTVTDPSDYE
jgi:N-methylhydantoinase B